MAGHLLHFVVSFNHSFHAESNIKKMSLFIVVSFNHSFHAENNIKKMSLFIHRYFRPKEIAPNKNKDNLEGKLS